MSSILVNKISSDADSADAGFTDIVGLSQSSVNVSSASNILLMIASIPQTLGGDASFDLRFAVDDILEGPEATYFTDGTDLGCGASLCWATTATAGTHKFAVQWRNNFGTPSVDTGRTRSFQVIEITNSSLLVNKSTADADTAIEGFSDIVGLTDTQTVASTASVLLLLANMNQTENAEDRTFDMRMTIAGTDEGPQLTTFRCDNVGTN